MDATNSKLRDAPFAGTSPVGVSNKPPAVDPPASRAATEPPNALSDSFKPPAPPAVEAVRDAPEAVPTHAPPAAHPVPQHVHDPEPAHIHDIAEQLQHDLQQPEHAPVADAHMPEEAKESVTAQQQHPPQAQEGPDSAVVQGPVVDDQGHQHDHPIHAHAQDMPVHEVPHDQVQQPIDGDEVHHAQHDPPVQQAVVHPAEHAQPHKMEEDLQHPPQEGAQPLEQPQDHAQMHADPQQMPEQAQEQYQEHVEEHHEQQQEQLSEQQQLQSQEQLEEHPDHAQQQVQEHQVPDHQQVSQPQDVQVRHDAVQQQLNPALATAAAAAASAAQSEKLVYEQVIEHAPYQQQDQEQQQQPPQPPIANPMESPRRAPGSSPETTPRRGAERYHASGEQLRTLVDAFEQDPAPSVQTLNFLSSSIGMPMHNLVLWFKNRRARHKKTHPNQPLKSGRRSYVKSGIYSRAKRNKQQQHMPASAGLPATMQQPTHQQIAHGMMLPPDPIDGQAVPELPQDQKPEVHNSMASDLTGTKRPHDDQGMVGPTVPKRTKYTGVKELIGEDNPCRLWDGQECHRRCIDFFERTLGGRHPEQINAARIVSAEFFLSEIQSGLTLTSAMQPLETSVAILDNIMDRLPTDAPNLSSGSRVILREFFAQIRSGNAINVQPASNIEEAAENMEATPVAENMEAAPVAESMEATPAAENAPDDNTGGEGAGGEHTATEAEEPPAAASEE